MPPVKPVIELIPTDWILSHDHVYALIPECEGLLTGVAFRSTALSFESIDEDDLYLKIHASSESRDSVVVCVEPDAFDFLVHLSCGFPLVVCDGRGGSLVISGTEAHLQDLSDDLFSEGVQPDVSMGGFNRVQSYLRRVDTAVTWWNSEYGFHMMESILH